MFGVHRGRVEAPHLGALAANRQIRNLPVPAHRERAVAVAAAIPDVETHVIVPPREMRRLRKEIDQRVVQRRGGLVPRKVQKQRRSRRDRDRGDPEIRRREKAVSESADGRRVREFLRVIRLIEHVGIGDDRLVGGADRAIDLVPDRVGEPSRAALGVELIGGAAQRAFVVDARAAGEERLCAREARRARPPARVHHPRNQRPKPRPDALCGGACGVGGVVIARDFGEFGGDERRKQDGSYLGGERRGCGGSLRTAGKKGGRVSTGAVSCAGRPPPRRGA